MKSFFTLIYTFLSLIAFTQTNNFAPQGGGEFIVEKGQCITDAERAYVNQIIEENIKKYNLSNRREKMMIRYDWPVAQNPAFDYNSTYAISNFVDHDPMYPNDLLDYNCGNHTYDTNSGYNHQGIDIFLWPFDHNQVADEQTYAVAAADGIILAKQDGQPDDNCALNSSPANYVILEHSDGSRSWYWHLKLNSVTTKSIGASVTSGEYLGVIASSGNSTGPHLHFECYDSGLNLIDPYAGTCNSMNTASFWNSQKPYWDATVNTVFTHTSPPNFNACPNLDVTNIEDEFGPGDVVYFIPYFHDYQTTDIASLEITKPDGSTWYSWTHSPTVSYRASYYWWYYTLPSSDFGKWNFTVSVNGTSASRDFYVCPTSHTLSGNQTTSNKFETDGAINSTQNISGSTTEVTYDSGSEINLNTGFETQLSALFEAYIDGCGDN